MAINTTNPDPLARPISCKMRPISPIEVVNQLISAKKVEIGKNGAAAEERLRREMRKALEEKLKSKTVQRAIEKVKAASKALTVAREILAKMGLEVSHNGNVDFTYREKEHRLKDRTSRTERLEQLAKVKADAMADLIGLDVEQTRAYLQRFKTTLDRI